MSHLFNIIHSGLVWIWKKKFGPKAKAKLQQGCQEVWKSGGKGGGDARSNKVSGGHNLPPDWDTVNSSAKTGGGGTSAPLLSGSYCPDVLNSTLVVTIFLSWFSE